MDATHHPLRIGFKWGLLASGENNLPYADTSQADRPHVHAYPVLGTLDFTLLRSLDVGVGFGFIRLSADKAVFHQGLTEPRVTIRPRWWGRRPTSSSTSPSCSPTPASASTTSAPSWCGAKACPGWRRRRGEGAKMARQHIAPLLLGDSSADAIPLTPLSLGQGADGAVNEAYIRDLIFSYPQLLPIAEVDSEFVGAIPICTELATPAGYVDVLLLTPSGLPVIVECKLWRNPEARREVVGQILDYAKELSRFSASDLKSAVGARLKRHGDVLLDLVRKRDPVIDEATFNDALTRNLRRGRFLLLITPGGLFEHFVAEAGEGVTAPSGDGIREGTEAIAEYLQAHGNLHFTLGLVELPMFALPSGGRLVAPRVLAHTKIITHTVVAVPDGYMVQTVAAAQTDDAAELDAGAADRLAFWTDFLGTLNLSDDEQPRPKPNAQGNLSFMMPVKGGSCWLTVYRNSAKDTVGVFLSYSRNSPGERAVRRVLEDFEAYRHEFLSPIAITTGKDGRSLLSAQQQFGSFTLPDQRSAALLWLQASTNEFVSTLRSRIRAAAADASTGE